MNVSIMAALAATLILLILLGEWLWRSFGSKAPKKALRETKWENGSRSEHRTDRIEADFFTLPEAREGAVPAFAVIDFQTTGLSTTPGEESPIIQAAWLILDKEFRVIRQRLSLVRQTERSGYEAQMVHHIPYEKVLEYGLPEEELLQDLMYDLKGVPLLVFHHATFDLSILRGGLRRTALPGWDEISYCPAFCTMTFLPELSGGEREEKYLSLVSLTAKLTGKSLPRLSQSGALTAWRNVCLTRVCLVRLSELYPADFPAHIRPASDFLDRGPRENKRPEPSEAEL